MKEKEMKEKEMKEKEMKEKEMKEKEMKEKEMTKEMLVGAANDLNKVLELKPPVVTEFTSSLKGAALNAVEKKFMDQLGKDLVEVATCSDDKGKLLLQPTDILQPTTIDVLEVLGVEGIREKVGGKEAPSPKAASKKKGAGGDKKKKAADEGKKDQFGFREGSKANLFAKMVVDGGKTGITMDDVKKAKWNENSATYFGTLSKMKKSGQVKVVDGKIIFVKK